MSHPTSAEPRFGFLRWYPLDLAVVSLAAALAYAAVTNLEPGTAPRLLATFPLALFLPGYALVSVLFPAGERSARRTARTATTRRPRGIDVAERLALGLALSIAVGPIVVIALPFAGFALEAASVAGGLAAVAIGLAQLGVVRRLRTPAAVRFTVSIRTIRERLGGGVGLSSVVLGVAIAVALGALLAAFLFPASAGGYDQLSLYSETEDGELVAGEFPDEVAPGESVPVTIEVENGREEPREYAIVVQEQVVESGEVVDRTERGRIGATVGAGSTADGTYEVAPTAEPGETVRISVLLFEGEEAPTTPTEEDALEEAYFWVTVAEEPEPDEAESE
ncbi:DUF1616 domain-containing protein [Natronococcus jeotgali]|uniref:DUF1616 domain-containing protein n=1 Tax=Natronococcus jeotgali DSM 18795 TaxID=1227498 RepID=L9WZS1_9EURY|nr:DUF1616 domain-containing protein [Natronococcus jeotgali]ELY54887.1 hypothetical protein C492_16211 [Natronococcus jeotgali DSM 18795]